MSDRNTRSIADRPEGSDGRRRQLRTLLLNAADAARQTRRMSMAAARMGRPVGRAIRDRVSMLLSAAG